MTVLLAGFVVLLMAGGGFVIYKLWNRQKVRAAAQRWEVRLPLNLNRELEPGELETFLKDYNEKLDRYEVMKPVVDELDLVAVWGVADEGTAIESLKGFTNFKDVGGASQVMLVVSDKDQELARKLGPVVGKYFDDMIRREQFLAPPSPPSPAPAPAEN